MNFQIPSELIDMLKQRKVIPFIGAGFSSGHGLPDWDTLLKNVSEEVSGIPSYEKIKADCNNDYLQVAEYLYIKSDKNIGPIRHKLATLLQTKHDCLTSTAHVELVNLNAQQIYTTNYDELIEKTFQSLSHPYAFVALPKHISSSSKEMTQVVKYHGDLRFDQTLVLTESSYYNRLEFESPMDLKFRSDLLGQSVLFVGYSFRDINIRIIWFKLMDMMRDVPEADRPSSYIVRFERNEVLETLYKSVGIKTIYLDPANTTSNKEEKTKILGNFMLSLSMQINSQSKMPQSKNPMFLSQGLIDTIQSINSVHKDLFFMRSLGEKSIDYIEHASQRQIPAFFRENVDSLLEELARKSFRQEVSVSVTKWAISFILQSKDSSIISGAIFAIIRSLMNQECRELIFENRSRLPWDLIWNITLTARNTEFIMHRFRSEMAHFKEFGPDEDLAYITDIGIRIIEQSLKVEDYDSVIVGFKELVKKAIAMFPAFEYVKTKQDGLTDLDIVLADINSAITDDDREEPPF